MDHFDYYCEKKFKENNFMRIPKPNNWNVELLWKVAQGVDNQIFSWEWYLDTPNLKISDFFHKIWEI